MIAAEAQRCTADAWLVIATGGWWKTTEVAQALGLDRSELHNRLRYMTEQQYLVRRVIPDGQRELGPAGKGARQRMEYAVRPDCKVPMGLTAQQVSDALVKGIAA